MNKIVLYTHRKRLLNYFEGIAEKVPNSVVLPKNSVFRHIFPPHLPGKIDVQSLLDYECAKSLYKPKPFLSRIRCGWISLLTYIQVIMIYSGSINLLKKQGCQTLVVWGAGGIYQKLMALAGRKLGCRVFTMENGFMPDTTAIDSEGVNAESQLPRDKDFYLSLDESKLPEHLPEKLVVREHKKPIKNQVASKREPKNYIFVPFQCNADSVIILHSPRLNNMWQLFYDVINYAKKFPEIDFVLKEHPSCPENYQELYDYLEQHKVDNVLFSNADNTQKLIQDSMGVMTINSSVGFEALLFSKPVISLGNAAYNVKDIVLYENANNAEASIQGLIDGWKPEPKLLNLFLRYVYHDYLVRGTRRDDDSSHFEALANRILGNDS